VAGGERWRDTTAEASAAVLAAVVEHAGLGIALMGLDGITFQANPAFCRMTGYDENELLIMTFAEFTHPDDVEREESLFAELLEGVRDLYRVEKRYVRPDGVVVWGALTVSAVRSQGGGLLFAVGMAEDITEQRRLQGELQHQALHDHLTGLPNRRLFDDRLSHAQRLARRQDHGLAVVALDLDGFKTVNDTHGHAAGDEVLIAVAARLAAACRESDTVARVGGDEFAVLCEGSDADRYAPALAERLRTALSGTLVLSSGAQTALSASVGFAVAEAADAYDTLLRRADAAMYSWKS
jgi:diguanylate cyclase (GGDEF)-like protein/PAS domain S-box-containing protein